MSIWISRPGSTGSNTGSRSNSRLMTIALNVERLRSEGCRTQTERHCRATALISAMLRGMASGIGVEGSRVDGNRRTGSRRGEIGRYVAMCLRWSGFSRPVSDIISCRNWDRKPAAIFSLFANFLLASTEGSNDAKPYTFLFPLPRSGASEQISKTGTRRTRRRLAATPL
jgi:hypothetical protein